MNVVVYQTDDMIKQREKLEKQFTGNMSTFRTVPVYVHPAEVGRRFPAAPSWWRSDEDASAASMAAMGRL
jgi:hypothetical protein